MFDFPTNSCLHFKKIFQIDFIVESILVNQTLDYRKDNVHNLSCNNSNSYKDNAKLSYTSYVINTTVCHNTLYASKRLKWEKKLKMQFYCFIHWSHFFKKKSRKKSSVRWKRIYDKVKFNNFARKCFSLYFWCESKD